MTDTWLSDHLREIVESGNKGVRCPSCTQRVAVDRRHLSRMMARFLVRLVYLFEEEPAMYSTRQILGVTTEKVSSDGAFLLMWGLIEKGNPENENKKGTYYAPTPLGIAFVKGKVRVPAYKDRMVGKVIYTSEESVDIYEALKVPHGYEDLLGAPPSDND